MKKRIGNGTLEWFGDVVANITESIVDSKVWESAKRVEHDARANTPVGEWERTAPPGSKNWLKRQPGTARKSVKALKSKFKDGGYIIVAGGEIDGYDAYYYQWIELGAPNRGIPQRRPMRRALKKEERRLKRELKKALS